MKRLLNVGALASAIVSLAVLGWLAFRPAILTGCPDTEVTLWTAGATPAVPAAVTTHVALPDASSAPDGALRVPDTAFLRREFRSLRRVTIAGEGLAGADAENLRGLAVTWQRPERAAASPMFVALSAPRTLAIGQPFTVQGRVRGLTAGVTGTLTLEAPNGAVRSLALEPVRDADLAFSIASDVAGAAGAFEWKLRLGAGGTPLILGAMVTAPELPRVLLLAASPNVEAARLQRWLAESGARVTARTRVSADHMRFTAANDSPAEFPALDAAVLDSFDVVVARESALSELSANERAALEEAVRDRGLGLLLVGEPAAPGPGPFFAPWKFAGDERGAAGGDEPRLVRLRLAGGTELAEPVATLVAEIIPAPLVRWLARDPQGRVLCAAMRRGHGWVARSLLIDTWRWSQGGHPEIFGAYWSEILSAIARPPAAGPGRWSLEKGSAPLFAGEPIQLAWVGAPEAVPATALAGRRGATVAIPLNCSRDPAEPARAEAIYWPAQPGWHEVRFADGKASLAFYVQAASALPAWRAERRRIATARLVATGTNAVPAAAPAAASPDRARTAAWMAWMVWSVFLLGAGVLWSEQRNASRSDLAGPRASTNVR